MMEKSDQIKKVLEERKHHPATLLDLLRLFKFFRQWKSEIITTLNSAVDKALSSLQRRNEDQEKLLREGVEKLEIVSSGIVTKEDVKLANNAVLRDLDQKMEKAPGWYEKPDGETLKVLTFLVLKQLGEKPEVPDEEEIIRRVTQGLREREKELLRKAEEIAARVAQALQRPMGGGLNRQAVLDLISANAGGNFIREDLSSQCDGSNKVFTITESYVATSVALMGTQFPIVYRPTTDFTESADKEVTLTGEVGAPATGQTLVAIYEKS